MNRLAILAITLFLLLMSSTLAFADSPAEQYDYIIEVGDGQCVFVMLVQDELYEYSLELESYYSEFEVIDEEIRAKYSQSGLYRADDSSEAIYTVAWYAFNVDITSDCKHLVRWGPWASSYGQMALEFYENGKKLLAYRVKDLVAEPEKLPHSVSHFTWKAEAEFNEEKKELYLRTYNDEEFLFDVTTGCVIEGTLTRSIPRCSKDSYATQTSIITLLSPSNEGAMEESDSRQYSDGVYLLIGVILLIILIAVAIFINRRIIRSRNRA